MVIASKDQPIGVFDSGIGGLTVANAILTRLPRESLLYVADTAHVPYGPQPAENILAYSRAISAFLLSEGCKLIVVACNTASAAAINHLRAQWPEVTFVGTEPAVKPAAQSTRSRRVGVLATQGTFRSERYASLMSRFAEDVQVFEDPCLGLVPLIEAGQFDTPATEALLRGILQPMLDRGADTLVLGCTHYPLVSSLIQRIAGPDVQLIDPAPAIARRVEMLLQSADALSQNPEPGRRFLATGDGASLLPAMRQLFGRTFPVERLKLSIEI